MPELSGRRVIPRFPIFAQAAHGFAESHGEFCDGLQALLSTAREPSIVLPPHLREQQLRISQDPGERLVQLVAEDLTEGFARVCVVVRSAPLCRRRLAGSLVQPFLRISQSRWHAAVFAGNKIYRPCVY